MYVLIFTLGLCRSIFHGFSWVLPKFPKKGYRFWGVGLSLSWFCQKKERNKNVKGQEKDRKRKKGTVKEGRGNEEERRRKRKRQLKENERKKKGT